MIDSRRLTKMNKSYVDDPNNKDLRGRPSGRKHSVASSLKKNMITKSGRRHAIDSYMQKSKKRRRMHPKSTFFMILSLAIFVLMLLSRKKEPFLILKRTSYRRTNKPLGNYRRSFKKLPSIFQTCNTN